MQEIKSYFDFYTWLVENLIETNSNNVKLSTKSWRFIF